MNFLCISSSPVFMHGQNYRHAWFGSMNFCGEYMSFEYFKEKFSFLVGNITWTAWEIFSLHGVANIGESDSILDLILINQNMERQMVGRQLGNSLHEIDFYFPTCVGVLTLDIRGVFFFIIIYVWPIYH